MSLDKFLKSRPLFLWEKCVRAGGVCVGGGARQCEFENERGTERERERENGRKREKGMKHMELRK